VTDVLPLEALGRRIIVLGPTNAGKSTLAVAIGARLGIAPIFLDQLHHLPGTNWVPRNAEAFRALHDAAIAGDSWVMDGSYSRLMPQRLERATGIIVLDDTLAVRTRRYLWRSLFQKHRPGGLEGHRETVRLAMLLWLWKTRNRSEAAREFARKSGLPYVFCRSTTELRALYTMWGLARPAS